MRQSIYWKGPEYDRMRKHSDDITAKSIGRMKRENNFVTPKKRHFPLWLQMMLFVCIGIPILVLEMSALIGILRMEFRDYTSHVQAQACSKEGRL